MTPSSELQWHRLTALFGGTFDPPHVGHREALRGLFRDPGIRRVIVLPSAVPPHKAGVTEAEHRVAMARLAFTERAIPESPALPGPVEVDAREIELARQTGQPSYSFDTVQTVRREIGEVAFVIGTDQLEALPSWYRFPELLSICHWIVLERKPSGPDTARRVLQEWVGSGLIRPAGTRSWATPSGTLLRLVSTDAPELAARDIRVAIQKTGKPPENALNEPVYQYLKTHRLYGSADK